MYGKWLGFTLGGIAVVLLLIGLAFSWASPLFAIPVLLGLIALFFIVALGRRAGTEDEADPRAAASVNRPDRPDAGKAEPSH